MSDGVRQIRLELQRSIRTRDQLAARRDMARANARGSLLGIGALLLIMLLALGVATGSAEAAASADPAPDTDAAAVEESPEAAAAAALVDEAERVGDSNGVTTLTKVDASRYPTVRVQYTVDTAEGGIPRVSVSENEREVQDVSVFSGEIGQYDSESRTTIMLTIDASESMTGSKIANAKAAAAAFVEQAREGDRIGVVTFGETAELVQEPTDNHDLVKAAILGISLTEGTATYDAVKLAAESFPSDSSRNVVLLMSDGAELGSAATLDEALAATAASETEVVSVGITGGSFERSGLTDISTPTGGFYEEVTDAADLSALYESLGQQLLRSYWLEYNSTKGDGKNVIVTLTVDGQDPVYGSFKVTGISGASEDFVAAAPSAVERAASPLELPSGAAGKLIVAAPFAAAIFLWYILHQGGKGRPTIERRILPYVETKVDVTELALAEAQREKGSPLAALYATTERFVGKSGTFDRYQSYLDAANLPLRPVELLWARLVGMFILGMLGILVLGVLGLLLGGFAGFRLPLSIVKSIGKRRRKAFDLQLADVLNTIASSLKAGHSFNQSMKAVVNEAGPPVSDEFQRAMTEAGLGLPMEEALASMAERLGSEDFEFVVTTVNIQRTVGGSLAEILEMVGDTVRGRQQFRKRVKALTSMGRASMWVLLGMPFAMAGMLSLMSREYMAPLWSTTPGHIMIGLGLFLMTLGYFACAKIVAVKM